MDKIRQVREKASYNGLNQERLQELYEKALELQREAEAANHLLEMLNE